MKRPTTRPRKITALAVSGAARAVVLTAFALLAAASTAHAQLDPLISLKRVPPRIVIVFDTSFSMLYDMSDPANPVYCDPAIYTRNDDPQVANDLGVNPAARQYRRRFTNLAIPGTGGYTATGITTVSDQSGNWGNPCANTRYEIARKGITWALQRSGNPRLHWGLVKLRQNAPTWRVANASGCEIVSAASIAAHDVSPCNAGGNGNFAFNPPSVSGRNVDVSTSGVLVSPAAGKARSLADNYFDATDVPLPTSLTEATANALIPAGRDTATSEDRPLELALTDAKAEIQAAMGGDTLKEARNTVVVLIAAGKDYSGDPVTRAADFLTLSGSGMTRRARVPIYVVGVSPKTTDESQLSDIATASGGLYVKATSPLAVERAINLAIQAGCQRASELDAGRASEFPLVSPVVGTVNLDNAQAATGVSLTNTVISTPAGGSIPQRNNLLLVASFALGPASISLDGVSRGSTASRNPGFEGRLRAYRAYKPITDATKPSGYTFTKDGTPLWPDRDGRPELAGIARTPANSADRNIFTYLPGGAGMVPFDSAHLGQLQTALNSDRALEVIEFVRRLPLGGIISSTPAVMDPPSLDPPPDEDYGRPAGTTTYAGRHKDRRAIIWVGANDGMLHAIDARTGYEVWAFIPYNLLPKLQALLDGQSPYEFTYFMDQSPKIAEVKVGGNWKSLLIIGQGWGGTFYQAFDVTEAGMGGPSPDRDEYTAVLSTFADGTRVRYLWSFPDYAQFDPTAGGGRLELDVADTTSFGRVRFFGDLKTTASTAEKKVGFTWSDPAVGALNADRSVNAAIVGSGYFPPEAETSSSALAARQNAGVGRAFYLINVETGKLVGNASGSSCTGTGCIDVGDSTQNPAKNALQADPTVTSDYGSYIAKKAYIGDLDGTYWRFTFDSTGAITKTSLKSTGQSIYASSALMWIGSTDQYIFFSTGSDMLPTSPAADYRLGKMRLYGLKENSAGFGDAFTYKELATVTNVLPENPAVNDVNGRPVGIPAGERPSTSPSVAGEIVFFTTTVEGATAPAEPTFNLYALAYSGCNAYQVGGCSGTSSGGGSGGGNGNGNGNGNGGTGGSTGGSTGTVLAAAKSGTGRATAPFVVDQHLYFATTSGSAANVEAFGDPNDYNNGVGQVGVRILSWREIRR